MYALLAYAEIRSKNPETLLVSIQCMATNKAWTVVSIQLQRPDNESTQKVWNLRATIITYFVALYVHTTFVITHASHEVVITIAL